MNKSVLGTVFGVGLLSFIKRQSGSSVRLTLKDFADFNIQFKMRVPIVLINQNEEYDQIQQRIIGIENLIDDLIVHDVSFIQRTPFNPWDKFEPYTQLTIELDIALPSILIEENMQKVGEIIKEKVRNLTQIVSGMVSRYEAQHVSIAPNFSLTRDVIPLELINGTVEEFYHERRFEEDIRRFDEDIDSINLSIKRNDDPECGIRDTVKLEKSLVWTKFPVNMDTGERYQPSISKTRLRKR